MAEVTALDEARTQPQDEEAENYVLGAMMLSPGAIGAVSEIVDAGHFFKERNGKIYRAAVALYVKGEPVDAITLANELEERGELEDVGGRGRLRELAAIVPATANAPRYAEIVRETATLRGLVRAGLEIARMGFERGDETGALVGRAEQLIYELAQAGSDDNLVLFKDTLKETFTRISELYETGADVTGVPSGFRDLDQITAGFQPGNLIILAARPSMGKSALGLSIAANVVMQKQLPCAFFSLEMSRQEIAQRLMCMEAKIDSHKIRTGKLSAEDWPKLTRACSLLESVPLFIDDTPGLNLLELRSRAQTLKRRNPELSMILVDYLQLMAAGGSVESRLQEVSAISRGLKSIAKDLDVPIIALSQLSRAVEQRHDKRPILSDLRESGTIEQDADVVMFIYRDDYYNAESEHEGLAEISVAKHRNGPTDTVKLAFLRRYARFASTTG
ncbi:MAG TPA: replicative DNA helicase [Gaiellaceae bacterium]